MLVTKPSSGSSYTLFIDFGAECEAHGLVANDEIAQAVAHELSTYARIAPAYKQRVPDGALVIRGRFTPEMIAAAFTTLCERLNAPLP